jgi:hypothetical protein
MSSCRFMSMFLLLSFASMADAQSWTPLAHQPPFQAGTALLLTDGTVMVQQMSSHTGTGNWWRLTPDNTGSYVNGTWSALTSMPAPHQPRFYASAVLPDGRVVIIGGEYNGTGTDAAESTLGAIYNPVTNSWTSIAPPGGVTQIGDASSVILPNGTFMLGPCCFQTTDWLLDPSTLTWTPTGSGKADPNAEEGWTLLPNGNVLTIDTENNRNSEIYNLDTGSWTSLGDIGVLLPSSGGMPIVPEIGPAVLRSDGTVFATGATSNTAIYDSASGVWSVGPVFPNGLAAADTPAALLPNGNVLVDTAPFFRPGTQFFEWDGSSLISVPGPPSAAGDVGFDGRMLVLPTGQILFTNESSSVQIYSSTGTFQSAWQPVVTSAPPTLSPGSVNYNISGTQFNGLSQGVSYGDDAQTATNYPLIRITNNSTGHVTYARTHNHSTMAVATGSAIVSTQFDMPSNTESGSATLQVVANGIPSNGVAVQVASSTGGCGEATCVPAQAAYISHFTGAGCTGIESYYTPYDGSSFSCRTWDGGGQCGTIHRTVTNISYKYNGFCTDAWPSGHTLSDFVTVYRGGPPLFLLSVGRAGTGTGTVVSNPAGISCGATCSSSFTAGTAVTLTASPGAGSTFAGWSGAGCSGTGPCIVTMNVAQSVTATFDGVPTLFTLTVSLAGPGTGSVTSNPAGISCGATCSGSFAAATVVTLSASAGAGSTFAGWSGAGCSGTGPCTLTMNAAQSVTATFNTAVFSLTVSLAGTGTGVVVSSPSGISCGVTCSSSFTAGTVVTLTASAGAGSTFAGWNSAVCSGTNTCTITMNATQLVTAVFTTASSGCGEASCVPAQAAHISHFTGPGCTGTESYYTPYDNFAFSCRTWDGGGQCGTIHRTVSNVSYKYSGVCTDAWPSGNTLSDFVTVYR